MTTSNDVVDATVSASSDQSVVPSSAFERDQLVKIKKAMEMLQLQVQLKSHFRFKICILIIKHIFFELLILI